MPDKNGTNVRMNGKKRPRNTASGPHLSSSACDLAMRSGVIDLTLPDAMMRWPKKWPMAKLHWSPRMAAHHTVTSSGSRLRPPPSVANTPAANSSESPGRNGMTTTPVSMKMMRKSGAYTQTAPSVVIQPAIAARGSWIRLTRYSMGFMGATLRHATRACGDGAQPPFAARPPACNRPTETKKATCIGSGTHQRPLMAASSRT